MLRAKSAAERACKHKRDHYTQTKASILFVGFAFETLGTVVYRDQNGKMLIEESDDKHFLSNNVGLSRIEIA